MKECDPAMVKITDIKMPFWSLVELLIKLTLAAIPAMFILAIISFTMIALLLE